MSDPSTNGESAAVEIVLPAVDDGLISSGLYELSKALGQREPEAQSHGLLGGEWGYGQDYVNDVFEMFPFWWGDCECPYDPAEMAWSAVNKHTPECFHTGYMALYDSLRDPFSGAGDKALTDYRERHGVPSFGCMVYCDCGYQERWEAFLASHQHDERCPSVRPNFKHHASGLEVRWYKYIGRSMEVSQELDAATWLRILGECMASLNASPPEDGGS